MSALCVMCIVQPNAYASQSIELFADIANWLNYSNDAQAARRTAAHLRSRIATVLFNSTTGLFVS